MVGTGFGFEDWTTAVAAATARRADVTGSSLSSAPALWPLAAALAFLPSTGTAHDVVELVLLAFCAGMLRIGRIVRSAGAVLEFTSLPV